MSDQEMNRSHTKSCAVLGAEFSHNGSIHGIKYLNKYRNTAASQIFWTVILAFAVCCCSFLLYQNYMNWSENPKMIRVAEELSSIRNIPFPAVTICPETKSKMKLLNITEAYHAIHNKSPPYDIPDEILSRVEAVSHICDPHLFHLANLSNEIPKTDPVEVIKEIGFALEDLIFICRWRNKLINCFDIFQQIVTDEGVCYSFNSLDASQILRRGVRISDYEKHVDVDDSENYFSSFEKDGSHLADFHSFPHHVSGVGVKSGLVIVLQQKQEDLNYICRGPVQGFKIYVHNPSELPATNNYIKVPLKQEVIVTVKPQLQSAINSLKSLKPEERNCYFADEKPLKYFKHYSYHNCELECLSKFQLRSCGCVKFSMPRSRRTNVCEHHQIKCYEHAESQYYLSENRTKCNCLPACNYLSYDTKTSQANFEFNKLLEAFQSDDMMEDIDLSRLSIVFEESFYSPTKIVWFSNLIGLIASSGGLLAVCLGASLLSIVEIFYFLVYRSRQQSIVRYQWELESEDLVNNSIPQRLFVRSGNIPQHLENSSEKQKH